MITGTAMPTKAPDISGRALYQLMTWLSPSYPVGAYTYSHGLEHAVDAGWVTGAVETRRWIAAILEHGDGMTDAVMLAEAYRCAGDAARLVDVLEFAAAFIPTAELALESTMQGAAFLEITQKAWPSDALDALQTVANGPIAYPVAVGVACAGAHIPLEGALHAYLHAFAANMVSAAVRVIPLGQTDGQLMTAALMSTVDAVVARALETPLDDISTNTLMADISSMKHETQYTRLFRS